MVQGTNNGVQIHSETRALDARIEQMVREDPICLFEAQMDDELANELTDLLDQYKSNEIDDEGKERLAELMERYRADLVQKAQAITDWLGRADVPTSWSAVTQLQTVRSTMLYAVGYDEKKRVLEVVFNSGGIYRYHDVPPHIYRELLRSSSVGRYMWEHVLGHFPLVRIQRRRRRAA